MIMQQQTNIFMKIDVCNDDKNWTIILNHRERFEIENGPQQ